MSTSRLISALVAVVLVVMAIVAVRAGDATSGVVSSGQDLSDYFQRHPVASAALVSADLSDYFLRHPNGWPTIGAADPVVLKDLAAVRQATTKYHDVNVALADGYLPTDK